MAPGFRLSSSRSPSARVPNRLFSQAIPSSHLLAIQYTGQQKQRPPDNETTDHNARAFSFSRCRQRIGYLKFLAAHRLKAKKTSLQSSRHRTLLSYKQADKTNRQQIETLS